MKEEAQKKGEKGKKTMPRKEGTWDSRHLVIAESKRRVTNAARMSTRLKF